MGRLDDGKSKSRPLYVGLPSWVVLFDFARVLFLLDWLDVKTTDWLARRN
jgi:hypothetical protein